jgi:hypothetical protein
MNDTNCPAILGKTRWIDRKKRNHKMLKGLLNDSPAHFKYCRVTPGESPESLAVMKYWLNRPDFIRVMKLP